MTSSHPLVLVSPTSLPSVQSIQEPGWPSGNICPAMTEPSIFHLASLIQTWERVKDPGWSSRTVGKSTPDPSRMQGLLESASGFKENLRAPVGRSGPHIGGERGKDMPGAVSCQSPDWQRVICQYCGEQTEDAPQACQAPLQALGEVIGPLGGLCFCPEAQQSCPALWQP